MEGATVSFSGEVGEVVGEGAHAVLEDVGDLEAVVVGEGLIEVAVFQGVFEEGEIGLLVAVGGVGVGEVFVCQRQDMEEHSPAATVGTDEEGVDLLAAGGVGLGFQKGEEVLETGFGDAGIVDHCGVGEVETVPKGDEGDGLGGRLFWVAAREEECGEEENREEIIHFEY